MPKPRWLTNFLISGPILVSLLSGCTGSYQPRIISPTGSPNIALLEYHTQHDTNTTPNYVQAQFLGQQYDMVVFDMINGIRSITLNQADFRLFRPLTSGNYYLVGLDKAENEPVAADSYVVVFGQNLISDLVFKKLYPEISPHYVDGVNNALAVASSGLHEGNAIDYVLLAQPSLYNALNNENATTYGRLRVVDYFGDTWANQYNQQIIPQAGLFIRYQDGYLKHQDYYDDFLLNFDAAVERAIDSIDDVLTVLDESYPDLAMQNRIYGFDSALVANLYASMPNPFGLIPYVGGTEIDFNGFLQNVGMPEIDLDYVMFGA